MPSPLGSNGHRQRPRGRRRRIGLFVLSPAAHGHHDRLPTGQAAACVNPQHRSTGHASSAGGTARSSSSDDALWRASSRVVSLRPTCPRATRRIKPAARTVLHQPPTAHGLFHNRRPTSASRHQSSAGQARPNIHPGRVATSSCSEGDVSCHSSRRPHDTRLEGHVTVRTRTSSYDGAVQEMKKKKEKHTARGRPRSTRPRT